MIFFGVTRFGFLPHRGERRNNDLRDVGDVSH